MIERSFGGAQSGAYVTDQYGATGAPTTGTWLTGQSIIDSAGTVWNCTTGGTPGTWAQKGAAAPLTLTAGTATTVPLTLVGAASQTADLLHIENSAGTVIVSINNSGNLIVGSLNVGYANGISSTAGAINGYFVPGVNRANSGYFQGSYYGGLGLSIPGSGTIGTVLTSGSGAPTIGGALGDIYFRTDTPATANQRVYICTTAGVAGAAVWTGIL